MKEVRCLCLVNAKKQQSMADGSADLDGFPVSEGETLNSNVCSLGSTFKEGWLRPASIPDVRLFNYVLLSCSILMC
jgi:hypothetical protein